MTHSLLARPSYSLAGLVSRQLSDVESPVPLSTGEDGEDVFVPDEELARLMGESSSLRLKDYTLWLGSYINRHGLRVSILISMYNC